MCEVSFILPEKNERREFGQCSGVQGSPLESSRPVRPESTHLILPKYTALFVGILTLLISDRMPRTHTFQKSAKA